MLRPPPILYPRFVLESSGSVFKRMKLCGFPPKQSRIIRIISESFSFRLGSKGFQFPRATAEGQADAFHAEGIQRGLLRGRELPK